MKAREALTLIRAQQRIEALEDVVIDLLRENPHQLVGGEAFARESISKILNARAEHEAIAPKRKEPSNG